MSTAAVIQTKFTQALDELIAEGITGFKKACDRIEAYRRQANAHAWSSAIVTVK